MTLRLLIAALALFPGLTAVAGAQPIDYEFDGDTAAGLDASLEKVRKVSASHGLTWPQATPASSRELVTRRFRVQRFPTHMLIGPDRKLLVAGKDRRLRADNLLPTLQALIPER